MNYLAHALHCLDDPYQVAGVATPDWLGLTRPRLRCRSRHARPWTAAPDPTMASFARGVVQHHADDDWFHQTAAFGELAMELARQVREVTADADGMRPSFLGHILVELLLDATIAQETPEALDRYYEALAAVDARQIATSVGLMTGSDASQLGPIIAKFCELRFLYDYADDDRLLLRLNQVMRRVGLPELPQGFTTMLPGARRLVADRQAALRTPESVLAAQ
ncbi:MAG TPA: hypothetical protein VEQ85_04640 [Lacipirellulaceae bacterium]|nr:hypothetical protein [Lacipirellulaceae bacterium]